MYIYYKTKIYIYLFKYIISSLYGCAPLTSCMYAVLGQREMIICKIHSILFI